MYDKKDIELRSRYLDTANDEYCTIIDRMSSLGAIVQYDDGIVWDHNPDLFNEERFIKMPSKPEEEHPAMSDACPEDAHDFGNILANDETNEYSPRCNQCGLSLQALREFGGQEPVDYLPWKCENCGRKLPVGSDLREDKEDFFCSVCIAHETGDYWGLPDRLLNEEFTFECGNKDCEWRSESVPESGECPKCEFLITPIHSPS